MWTILNTYVEGNRLSVIGHGSDRRKAHDPKNGSRAAVEHVRDIFAAARFGFPGEFSASGLLNEKVDAGRDPYTVLRACSPSIADRTLDPSENRIGALFLCNVVVWEDEPGVQTVCHISIMKVARLAGMVPDDAA